MLSKIFESVSLRRLTLKGVFGDAGQFLSQEISDSVILISYFVNREINVIKSSSVQDLHCEKFKDKFLLKKYYEKSLKRYGL